MGSVEAALEIDPPGSSKSSTSGASASASTRPAHAHAHPHPHEYERIVALKRLLPDAARDKRRVDMFLREARLAAMLDHPNVVTAYDYGEIDGELFLAMEYVEGQSLSRVLRAISEAHERLSPAVIAFVLAEVCRGLHAAHELADPATGQPLQLVHRDVSPQNVMLGYDGRVRLLDFGVAKIETENVTKTGEVKGKTAYMSPEQAMGDAIDRRSDLFGVGSILFECLALKRMWGDGTDMDVIRKLALEEPPPLENTGAPVLPEGLSQLHAKLVARDAKDRPATALEVANALDAFVGNKDTAAHDLRTILDAHFAEQAREQRARLTSTLHEIAPDQADELRESVLPTSAITPIANRKASLVAESRAEMDATPAGTEASTPVSTSRLKIALALAVLVIAGALIWNYRSSGETETQAHPVTPIAAPPTTATATARTTATTPSQTTPAAATAPTAPSAISSVTPTVTSATARPRNNNGASTSTTRPAAPSVTTTSTTAPTTSKPTTSAKPPPVDEHPF